MNQEIIASINKMVIKDFSHIKSFIIIKEDTIIYEKYLKDYSENSLHETACIFKSFLSAVISIALQNCLIESVDKKIIDIFKEEMSENSDENFAKIKLKHFLTNTSGIDWSSPNYEFPENKRYMVNKSDIINVNQLIVVNLFYNL